MLVRQIGKTHFLILFTLDNVCEASQSNDSSKFDICYISPSVVCRDLCMQQLSVKT